MDITLKSEDGCRKIYEAKASWEEIAPRFDGVTKTLRSQARLPGFREGKAPEAMVRSRFRKEILQEVLEHLLEDAAKSTIDQFELKPVVEPYAAEVHLEDGQPFSAQISVEVAPLVPEISAEGVTIECPKLDVDEDQLGKALEGLRQRAALMKPIETEAQEGDYAMTVLHRKGQSKGLERFLGALSASDNPVEQALIGKKAGEEFEIKVEAHEHAEGEGHDHEHDHEHAHLAPGEYLVQVSKVARREVPELGDDLAKEMGVANLEELKDKVRRELESRAQVEMHSIQENKLIDALAAKYPFPVPTTQVERQIRSDLEEFAEGLARQGMDVGKAGIDWEKMAESVRPAAQKKVAAFYILDAVARQKSLEAADAEVDDYFARQAQGTRLTPDQLRAQAKKDDRMDLVKAVITHRKASDLLLSQASVTLTEGKAPSQEAP